MGIYTVLYNLDAYAHEIKKKNKTRFFHGLSKFKTLARHKCITKAAPTAISEKCWKRFI